MSFQNKCIPGLAGLIFVCAELGANIAYYSIKVYSTSSSKTMFPNGLVSRTSYNL